MPANEGPRKHTSPGAEPEIWEAVEPDIPALRSAAREIVGKPIEISLDASSDAESPKSATMLELDGYDKIASLSAAHRVERAPATRNPTPDQLAVIRWLDRFGCMTTEQLHRAVMPYASLRSMQALLRRMHLSGLIEWRRTQMSLQSERSRGGSTPRIWSPTARGFRLGQRSPGFYRPVIPSDRSWHRSKAEQPSALRHDLRVVGWWLAFDEVVGAVVDVREVLTPRYDEGKIAPPRIPDGRTSRSIELRDIWLGEGCTFAGVPDTPFSNAVHPDLTLQLEIAGHLVNRVDTARIDLLLELDRTKRPAYNKKKLARYDAFLTGWGLAHSRVEELGTQPIVIFTSPDEQRMLGLMRTADEVMTGRIGWLGDPAHQWYHPGRDHILFTTEEEVHRGSLRAWQLPEHPRHLREALCNDTFSITTVGILPPDVVPWTVP